MQLTHRAVCSPSASSVDVSIAASSRTSLTSATALNTRAGITTSHVAAGMIFTTVTVLVGSQTLWSVSVVGSITEACKHLVELFGAFLGIISDLAHPR